MTITYFNPRGEELAGLIPQFLTGTDTAQELFNRNYAHGGGWYPMKGWTNSYDESEPPRLLITYPGDPTLRPVARIDHEAQTIWIYENAWVAIEEADGSVEIARMD